MPAPQPEESFFDSLTSNPFVLPGAVGLVALLAGLGVMRLRRKGNEPGTETSFMESKLQADSFFGVSGGQRVDTRDASGAPSSSSLSYSLSQLDAIGDVDPVAEADVYLAYGRDLQAEEILKEALRTDPERLAIRTKLLEVYAKRADVRSFEAQARQLQELTGGVGEDWAKAQELGRQFDPANALYQEAAVEKVDIDTSIDSPEGMLDADDTPAIRPPETTPSAFDSDWSTPPQPAPAQTPAAEDDFDLDIDLDAGSKLSGLESTRPATVMHPPSSLSELSSSLDSGPLSDSFPELEPTGMQPLGDLAEFEEANGGKGQAASNPMDFDFGDLSLDLDEPAQSAAAPVAPAAPDDIPDLDASSLSFDLEAESDGGDPLQRKIELADEFRRIGDLDGARELLDEVLSKATGGLRARAQAMLDDLS